MKTVCFLRPIAAALVAACLCGDALGAPAPAPSTATLGRLAGPDRMARLIAGAKAEGSVTVYSSIPLSTMTEIAGAFEKTYGIKVQLYRAESTQLLQRAVTEARAGRHAADAVETAAPETEAMQRENLLETLALPGMAELMPGAVVPGRSWIASRLTIFVAGYNTNLIRAAEAPKTFQDLLDPKWKGRIGIEAENANWLMALSDLEGLPKTEALFRAIVARNGMSVRRGHTLLVQLIASGEVPIGLNVYNDHVDQAKLRGAPIAMAFLPPAIAMPLGLGVFRRAPHPHAAVLFADFLLGEGQRLIAGQKMIPTHLKYQFLPDGIRPHILDVPKYVNENRAWIARYRSLFSGRPG
jgi:iron(III) transport system substrate-binding protein